MKKLSYLLLIATVVFSCEDEDSSVITGKWLVQEYWYSAPGLDAPVNLITECSADDIYEFTQDEVFTIHDGKKICVPNDIRTEKYALRNHGREIWFQYGARWKIRQLNLVTCEIEILVPPISGITFMKLVLKRV